MYFLNHSSKILTTKSVFSFAFIHVFLYLINVEQITLYHWYSNETSSFRQLQLCSQMFPRGYRIFVFTVLVSSD